ncbi:hypothetical protein Fmac_006728 [Flemingia macrophylla]|uniref:Uncharacterized protein n=1 Tax=Flemingia macrophylla TaxID=520843 RepID=A0ABD1NBX9_9FABA
MIGKRTKVGMFTKHIVNVGLFRNLLQAHGSLGVSPISQRNFLYNWMSTYDVEEKVDKNDFVRELGSCATYLNAPFLVLEENKKIKDNNNMGNATPALFASIGMLSCVEGFSRMTI